MKASATAKGVRFSARKLRLVVDQIRGKDVNEAYVDEGRTLRRWKARAYGRATPVLRRSSHVTIVVDTREG